MKITGSFIITGLLGVLSSMGICQAQTMETNMAAFETPYGATSVNQIEMNVTSTRDANFNRVVMQQPSSSYSASAIGNLINVVTAGSNNTVVISAVQTNQGSQTASLTSGSTTTGASTSASNSSSSTTTSSSSSYTGLNPNASAATTSVR